jgi:valyl-tRNA synthetase
MEVDAQIKRALVVFTGWSCVRYNLFNYCNLSTQQETMPPYNPHDIEAKWLKRWNEVALYQVDPWQRLMLKTPVAGIIGGIVVSRG